MISSLKKRISILLSVVVMVIFAVYLLKNYQSFKPLLDLNPFYLVLLALANLGIILSNAIFIRFILVPHGKSIRFKESFFVSTLSSVGNFFAPVGGGFGLRAIYLKKKHNLPYNTFISTLAGNYILVFVTNSLLALIALFLLRHHAHTNAYTILTLLFGSIFFINLGLSIFRIPPDITNILKKNKFTQKFGTNLKLVLEGWNKIVGQSALLVRLMLLVGINLMISVIINWLIIHSLGFSIAVPQLLLFSVLGSLSLFINITPANIGIKEAIYLFSASVIGFSTNQILAIALIDRGVVFFTLLLLWLISSKMKDAISLEQA